jgi:inner membrane protein
VQKLEAYEFGLAYARSTGMGNADITVHPRPVSPFNWTVYVSDDERHRFAHINLVRTAPRPYQSGDGFIAKLDAPYLPRSQAIWVTRSRYGQDQKDLVRQAWNSEGLGFFRWFADLPAFEGLTESPTCAWFADLRFITPGRDVMPFRFGACREAPNAPWRAYERDATSRPLPLR